MQQLNSLLERAETRPPPPPSDQADSNPSSGPTGARPVRHNRGKGEIALHRPDLEKEIERSVQNHMQHAIKDEAGPSKFTIDDGE